MVATDYLVAHGATELPGRFRAVEPLGLLRGETVVVTTARGVELGEVLRLATPRHAKQIPEAGELVRRAGEDDLERAAELATTATRLLERAGELAEELGLPIAPLDAEILLDGEHAFLSYVRQRECDIRDLIAPLSSEYGLMVRPVDLTAESQGGCGSGGCGSGGCGSGGCGSGGCGSPTQEELRAYFAGLREQFEKRRVPLL